MKNYLMENGFNLNGCITDTPIFFIVLELIDEYIDNNELTKEDIVYLEKLGIYIKKGGFGIEIKFERTLGV